MRVCLDHNMNILLMCLGHKMNTLFVCLSHKMGIRSSPQFVVLAPAVRRIDFSIDFIRNMTIYKQNPCCVWLGQYIKCMIFSLQ